MLKKRIIIIMTIISLCLYYSGLNQVIIVYSKNMEKQKNYIVCTKSEQQFHSIQKKYNETEDINQNNENLLEKNHMISLKLTTHEAETLEDTPNINFVEEDANVKASSFRKNIWKDKSIHKKKTEKIKKTKRETEWNLQMIHADKIKRNNKENKIKIAILDSGVDFGSDIDIDPFHTISLIPGEEEMSPLFMDGTGHGNSVAGLIAAKDNNEGITGVNPNAEIYSIRVLDDNNSSPISRVIEGIYMAIEADVNIINMSFGMDTYSAALEQAVRDAKKAGILVIASTGNTSNKCVQYPAAFDEVMAVGSVDKNGDLAKSSAVGEQLEIVAPGELVRSTGIFEDELVASGTSLATPQVAAAASLIWEKDPSVSADFVRDLLKIAMANKKNMVMVF